MIIFDSSFILHYFQTYFRNQLSMNVEDFLCIGIRLYTDILVTYPVPTNNNIYLVKYKNKFLEILFL